MKIIKILVTGNIASGKSTLITNLQRELEAKYHKKVYVLIESKSQWCRFRGPRTHSYHDIYSSLYSKPKEDLENHLYIGANFIENYIRIIKDAEKNKAMFFISERSVFDGPKIYAPCRGLSPKSIDILEYNFLQLIEMAGEIETVDIVIYLKPPIELLEERIKMRNFKPEKPISCYFLAKLQVYYDRWNNAYFTPLKIKHKYAFDSNCSEKELVKRVLKVIDKYLVEKTK